MRSFIFFPLLASLLIHHTLNGQNKPEYSVLLIDTALVKNAESVTRTEKVKLIIESPRKYIYRVARTVTIFSKNSRQAHIIVPYDKYSHAEIMNVAVYDALGNLVRKVKKSEFEDRAYYIDAIAHDERFLGFHSFGGQLPYTLEYEWQITFNHTMIYPAWTPVRYKESLEKGSYTIDAPEGLAIHSKTLNYNFNYTKEISNKREIQTWQIQNITPINPESDSPPEHSILPHLLVTPSIFQVEEFTGSMSDWKSFGAFLYELNKGKDAMPPAMVDLIRQMIRNCKSGQEKIDTLYHWLQQNMRYVSVQLGIGGWQSFNAAYVEKNRYGDCKALSTFMKGMLGVAGIESYGVIIKWDEEDGYFSEDFVYPDFNHMMLYVPEENMWLECTSNYLPTGGIDKYQENKRVLLLTPEGGQIATTPALPDSSNFKHALDTIYLRNLDLKGTKKYYGNTQRYLRSMFYSLPAEEQKKEFLEEFSYSVNDLKSFNIRVDKPGNTSTLEYNLLLNRFGTSSGDRLFIPVKSLHHIDYSCPEGSKRSLEYVSTENYSITNDLYIVLPPDYSVEHIPPGEKIDFFNNSFSIDISVENQIIHVKNMIIERPVRLKPEEYKDLCNYYNKINKSSGQMIVLKKSRS